MSISFIFDMAAKSEALNWNSILQLHKRKIMLKLLKIKSNEPNLTHREISKHLGFSGSTIKRYRDDIKMDSPYDRKKE